MRDQQHTLVGVTRRSMWRRNTWRWITAPVGAKGAHDKKLLRVTVYSTGARIEAAKGLGPEEAARAMHAIADGIEEAVAEHGRQQTIDLTKQAAKDKEAST